MGFLLGLLPGYLLANFHCLGMCGPLAALLFSHPYRFLYPLGRLISISGAGAIAGFFGFILSSIFTGAISLFFGFIACIFAAAALFRLELFPRRFESLTQRFALLFFQKGPLGPFLFGFLSIFLPCGQLAIVFSASAALGSWQLGCANAFLFSLATSPALFFAMTTARFLPRFSWAKDLSVALGGFVIASISILRGLAEFGWIEHKMLVFESFPIHIVFY